MTNAAEIHAPARTVRVIGIGNADRGDDGVGALVAAALAGRLPADVSLLTRGGDMMNLGDDMGGIDALICIDAAAPMGEPGRIRRLDLAAQALPREMPFASSHAFGLADAIALAEALGVAPKDIVVFAIEGACFDVGSPVTPAVAAAVPEATSQVIAEVERLRGANRPPRETFDA
ncbi:hydrogenase maturation protease [Paraburkholderia kururiensis]|uniref:hydrogenase maturation protease n=1 Tax=Paraburkholderia kururiensis TaxID=984307 RepID=UPI0005A73041|nr:hydrogenase maturation protease [Paraburkholderia kururiensis]